MSVALNSKQKSSSLPDLILKFRKPLRTFHHQLDDRNPEFVIHSIEDQPGFYHMTAQGPRVKLGESIEIEQSGQYRTYQIDDVESYSEPSDMWMALLHKV